MDEDASGTATSAVFGYVRPVEGSSPPLDAAIQRTAIRACARGEGLSAPEIFEEATPDGRLAFAHLAHEVAARPVTDRGPAAEPRTVVVATLAVLGDTALERIRRALLLESLAGALIFADGVPAEEALLRDWEQRPDKERRRDRAREAMRTKALRGQVLGRPPFGYAAEDRVLVPHPTEAEVVKRIFREYVDRGEGLRRIAATLNREGIATRLGGAWAPGSVRTVLRNPVYTGLYRRLGVVVPSAHPALIDRATFHTAQRRMSERRTSRLHQERHDYPLSGLLRCGACGSSMIGERRAARAGTVVAYRCENATSRGTCRERSRRAEVLEAVIREELGRSDAHHPVAVRPVEADGSAARRARLERRLLEGLERWIAGEWRYAELLARVGEPVRELHQGELPVTAVLASPEEARRRLLREWDELDEAARSELLHATLAEAIVFGDEVRITRRR